MIIENFVLLIFKKFIYQKKNTTSSVSFMHFKAELKITYQIEYKIAMQKGMLHKHFSKWEPIAPLLQCHVETLNLQTLDMQSPKDRRKLGRVFP